MFLAYYSDITGSSQDIKSTTRLRIQQIVEVKTYIISMSISLFCFHIISYSL